MGCRNSDGGDAGSRIHSGHAAAVIGAGRTLDSMRDPGACRRFNEENDPEAVVIEQCAWPLSRLWLTLREHRFTVVTLPLGKT